MTITLCYKEVTAAFALMPDMPDLFDYEHTRAKELCRVGLESTFIVKVILAERRFTKALDVLRSALGKLVDEYLTLILALLSTRVPIDEIIKILQTLSSEEDDTPPASPRVRRP